jgi:hypothetical protein
MMDPPAQDVEDRKPIWDFMQNFWMDTDPAILLPRVAEVCARSKYTMADLEAIYWNEVHPAVRFNMWMFPAPEWAGFEINWLVERVLRKHRYGARLPIKRLHPYANGWWQKLRSRISELRAGTNS